MTTHEYVARLNVIDDDKHLGIINRLIVHYNLKCEYIASLEAENAALIAKNARLETAVDRAAHFYLDVTGACPLGQNDVCVFDEQECEKMGDEEYAACWREFLMQEGDNNGKD